MSRFVIIIAAAVGMLAIAPRSPLSTVPLVRGLTIVSVLQLRDGDRENTVVVEDVSPQGVTYSWRYRERRGALQPAEESQFARFVSAADMASAPRLNSVFRRGGGREETPGYTALTFSRAIYNRLRAEGNAAYTTMGLADSTAGLGGLFTPPVPFRGTLSLTSRETEPLSVLVNGRRTTLPTLHFRGRFTYQARSADLDFWVLADSSHPLILKETSGAKLYQTIRIDVPSDTRTVEDELARDCRAELPGIYFGFGSAELQPASAPALASVAALLARHAEWSLVVEGHTDSIGDAASNKTLSIQRAAAVRDALIGNHRIAAERLRSDGFGATRPREPNVTIEGRARNRRVELVRSCARGKS